VSETSDNLWGHLAVGDTVRIVRRFAGHRVDHQWTGKVVRRTPTRAYLDNRRYVDVRTGQVLPRYLDYSTAVETPPHGDTPAGA